MCLDENINNPYPVRVSDPLITFVAWMQVHSKHILLGRKQYEPWPEST